MPYQDLGSRTQTGVSDTTYQVNPFLLGTGWDVIFTPDLWASNLTDLEIWHMQFDAPVGSSLLIQVENKSFAFVQQGWKNFGDGGSAPIKIKNTQTLQLLWNVAYMAGPYGASNVQATATVWLRAEVPL
jgi:hypothetical protein